MPPRPSSPFFDPSRLGRPLKPPPDEAVPEEAEVADQQALSLQPERRLRTRVAGLFLFLPLLARLRFDQLVERADYPGSKMVPAHCALLSLLALKLTTSMERLTAILQLNLVPRRYILVSIVAYLTVTRTSALGRKQLFHCKSASMGPGRPLSAISGHT